MTGKLSLILSLTAQLLRTCADIDYYSYHDAPSSPTHDEGAEIALRVALAEYRPTLDTKRRGW